MEPPDLDRGCSDAAPGREAETPPRIRRIVRILGIAIGALWILGGAVFFLIRFTSVFYQANQTAVNEFLDRMP
jgi:hypothetical protein